MSVIVTIFVIFVIPCAALVCALIKREGYPFLLGIAAFTVSQILIRIPLINYISTNNPSFYMMQATQTILMLALLSFSAGIFEETARYLAIRYLMKKRTVKKAIFFGLGHGGIEAVLLAGIPLLPHIAMMNPVHSITLYLSATERFLAMVIHICLSVIVLFSVKQKKINLYILAIALHGLINLMITVIATRGQIALTMIVLAVLTALLVWLTIYFTRRYKEDDKTLNNTTI